MLRWPVIQAPIEYAAGILERDAPNDIWSISSAGQGCDGDGIVSSRIVPRAGGAQFAAEIVQTCRESARRPRPGAPAGSPCSAASVCGEQACKCPNSFIKMYHARACDAGQCSGPEVCTAARGVVEPDVCR